MFIYKCDYILVYPTTPSFQKVLKITKKESPFGGQTANSNYCRQMAQPSDTIPQH